MISLEQFQAAAKLIKGKVLHTPLIHSPSFSNLTGAKVYLKLENLQYTGSFKIRGATYKLLSRRREIGPQGVVAASAGNHAQGVALAAKRIGLPATIFMPEWASITKQEATKGYGGDVILEGTGIGESVQAAKELARAGRTFIHPYDDIDIITGQGTIGLEILDDLPDADLIVVPIGGGGLISGIACAAKALRPQVRIVGVQASACPSSYQSLKAGKAIRVEAQKSIADGITVKQPGSLTLPIIQEKVDEIVLVQEDQIATAILMLLERKKLLAEGAGAVSAAALLNTAFDIPKDAKVVLVISGGNVDIPLLDRIIRQGLFRYGRIMRFSVCLNDTPGTLIRLLALIAEQKANIQHIYHDRSGRDLPVYLSRVELELETRGHEHSAEVIRRLQEAGYQIQFRSRDCLAC